MRAIQMEADSSPGTQEGLKHGWSDLCSPSGHPDSFPKWPWLAHKNGGTVKPKLGLISQCYHIDMLQLSFS